MRDACGIHAATLARRNPRPHLRAYHSMPRTTISFSAICWL